MKPEKIRIVKIGGNIIDNPEKLEGFLDSFAAGYRNDAGTALVLVHGGGKIATELSARLSIPVTMKNGRRVTGEADLEIVTMVYAGLINKRIVAQLQKRGCNAAGLCGADFNAVRAHKRPPVPVDYGYAGDIDEVNAALLMHMAAQGIAPVIAPITHDGSGQLLNTNADSVATAIAKSLASTGNAEVELVFVFEKRGVLTDVEDENSLVRSIDADAYAALKEAGKISGGMIPKIENALKAVSCGVKRVYINETEIH